MNSIVGRKSSMVSWQYIAGFFDGEGSISPKNKRTSFCIRIAQNDITVLQRIMEFLNMAGIVSGMEKPNGKCNSLRITRRDSVTKFLKFVMPFVIVKKLIAQDTLRFLKLFPYMTRQVRGMLIQEGRLGF